MQDREEIFYMNNSFTKNVYQLINYLSQVFLLAFI